MTKGRAWNLERRAGWDLHRQHQEGKLLLSTCIVCVRSCRTLGPANEVPRRALR